MPSTSAASRSGAGRTLTGPPHARRLALGRLEDGDVLGRRLTSGAPSPRRSSSTTRPCRRGRRANLGDLGSISRSVTPRRGQEALGPAAARLAGVELEFLELDAGRRFPPSMRSMQAAMSSGRWSATFATSVQQGGGRGLGAKPRQRRPAGARCRTALRRRAPRSRRRCRSRRPPRRGSTTDALARAGGLPHADRRRRAGDDRARSPRADHERGGWPAQA